jgi:hypothetical protein
MDRVRRLLGVLAALVVVGSIASSPALAQVLEVSDEANLAHCPSVTTSGDTDINGGCLTHASSEGIGAQIRKHQFGIESAVSTCTIEFNARVSESMAGYIFEQAVAGPLCSFQACKDGDGEAMPWPMSGSEGNILEAAQFITTNFCVETSGGGTHEFCEIDIPYDSYTGQHRQEYGHAMEMPGHGVTGFRCELLGHWNSEIGGTHDGQAEQELIAGDTSPPPAPDLEVTDEATGNHCAGVTVSGTDVNGGCLTHAFSEGSVELRKHVFGVESHITDCNHEFAARVGEGMAGYVLEQILGGASCSRQACKFGAGEGSPWPLTGSEGAGLEAAQFITTTLCVESVGGGGGETCEIDVPFDAYANQHRQEYGHATEISAHGVSGFRCELIGHWNSEIGGTHDGQAEQELVVAHL